MKLKQLFAAGAAAAVLAFATAPAMATIVVSVSGHVTTGNTSHAAFGTGSLAGKAYTISFTLDETRGTTSVYAPFGHDPDDYFIVSQLIYGQTPAVSVSLTIDGMTDSFTLSDYAAAASGEFDRNNFASGEGALYLSGDASQSGVPFSGGGTTNDMLHWLLKIDAPTTPIPFDITQGWSPTSFSTTSSSGLSFSRGIGDGRSGYDLFYSLSGTVESARISTSGVPEPAAWTMMMLGFAGIGSVLRRRAVRVSAWMPARSRSA